MAKSITETSEQQNWQHKEYESKYGPAIRFTSPSGFHVELVGTSNVIRLLTRIALNRGEITTPDGSRFKITVAGPGLVLIDTEPWLNPGWTSGDVIGDVDGLAIALGQVLLEKAWTKSPSP